MEIGIDLGTANVLVHVKGKGIVLREPSVVAKDMNTGKVLAARQQRELMSIVSVKTGKPIARVSSADPRGFGLGVVQAINPTIGTFWFYQGETLGYRMIHV